ncbi:MAG: hypothetical protein LBC92_04020, partial [Rickettsiales bacterium]|nr:hypothetical protein [Rickettsiales bacterium]
SRLNLSIKKVRDVFLNCIKYVFCDDNNNNDDDNSNNSGNNNNNNGNDKKYNDIIFIIFVLFLSFIPISKINKNKELRLQYENRYAAKFPKWKIKDETTNKKRINNVYISDLSKYIGDRIRYRNKIMSIESSLNYHRYILKDGWMFNTWGVDLFKNEIIKAPQESYEIIVENIKQYKDFCKANKIKGCYIVYVPIKKYAMRQVLGLPNDLVEKSDEGEFINEHLKKNKIDFEVISLHKEWLEHSKTDKELIYYKTDIHETMYASWLEYLKVMNIIKKDFPNLKILKEDDFDIEYDNDRLRSECRYIVRVPDFACTKHKYKFYNNKINYFVKDGDGTAGEESFFHNKNAKNPQKVIMVGTSYTENMKTFYSASFKDLISLRFNNINPYKNLKCDDGYLQDSCFGNEIKKEKPDILIFQVIVNRGNQINRIKRMFLKL